MTKQAYEELYWNRVLVSVANNIGNPGFNMVQLAKEVGTSRSTLYRKIKVRTGLTYPAFILEIRLRKAYSLLCERKDVSMYELSELTGFGDARYFACCFKKKYGITPICCRNKFAET